MIRILRLAAVCACALALSGCISLLPKTKPAQLYRFGQTPPAAAPAVADASAPGTKVGVFRANATFQQEAAGDRMLGITGDRAAYIAQSRWVAPAEVLFNQAVVAAFDGNPGRVRLLSRGEAGRSDYVLRLDVRNFEARYLSGPKAAPTVVIRVRAAMMGNDSRAQPVEQVFEAQVRAGDNRVGAIVGAYDRALDKVLAELVAWTNENAAKT
jgi:cholesterol transport system auxiliary component